MELQWKALLTQVVGFLIVLWLLRKYAWGQLLAFTEKRRETIANEFATIEKSKLDADALRHEASEIASQIREDARRETVDLRVKANQDIGMEMDKANAAFRDSMVNSVIAATDKLIRLRLDDAQHRRLINEFLDEVATRPAGR
jgi:F-type H+-transporting ATPase subunit b